MTGAICSIVAGCALLLLGGLGIHSLAQATADRIPLIYASFLMGLLLLSLGTLRLVYRTGRRGGLAAFSDSGGCFSPSTDSSGSGHAMDCGHGDSGDGDSGGCGGDGGGGH